MSGKAFYDLEANGYINGIARMKRPYGAERPIVTIARGGPDVADSANSGIQAAPTVRSATAGHPDACCPQGCSCSRSRLRERRTGWSVKLNSNAGSVDDVLECSW